MKHILSIFTLCLFGFVLAFGQGGIGGKSGIGGKGGIGGGTTSGGSTVNCGPTTTPGSSDGGNANVSFDTACTTGADSNGYSVVSVSIWNADSSTAPNNLGVAADTTCNGSQHCPGNTLCTTGGTTVGAGPGWKGPFTITGCGTLSANTIYHVETISSSSAASLEGTQAGNCPSVSFSSSFVTGTTYPTLPTGAQWTSGINYSVGNCYYMYMTLQPL